MSFLSSFVGVVTLLTTCFFLAQGITITPETVVENDGIVSFTITPDNVTNTPWFLTCETVDGTAVDGTDYTSESKTVSDSDSNINVEILDRESYQGNRTFSVSCTAGVHIGDPLPSDATITITDDELMPVTIDQPSSMTVSESIGEINITIIRNVPPGRAFDLMVTPYGEAEVDVDFEVASSLSFAMDEVEKVLTVTVLDDSLAESDEDVCLYLNSTDIDVPVDFCITIKDNDTPQNFLCRRGVSQPCKNGGTCEANSTCTCEMGFEGVNCGIQTGAIDANCDPECVNGTCVASECKCDPGFAGAVCDRPAYYHECTATGVSLCITPFSVEDFAGVMFVSGYANESECVLVPAADATGDGFVDGCEGYVAVIPYNGTCGNLQLNDTTYQVVIIVQYTKYITRLSDEVVTLTCGISDGVLVAETVVQTGSSQGGNAGSPQTGEGVFAPAVLTLTDQEGNLISDPMTLGSIVEYCVSVENVPAFEQVIIVIIRVDNARDGDFFQELLLYDEGCFPNPGIIISGPRYVPDGEQHTMCFELEIFIFSADVGLPEAKFRTTVEFEVGPMFTPYVCAPRRRKREVGDGIEKLDATITILNPDVQQQQQQSGSSTNVSSTESSCGHWLVPAFIGLGVFTTALIIVIIILSIIVIRRYNVKQMP